MPWAARRSAVDGPIAHTDVVPSARISRGPRWSAPKKRATQLADSNTTQSKSSIVAAADEAACRAIEQTEIIRLSLEDQRRIAAAILNPPAPNRALKKAARRYRELIAAE